MERQTSACRTRAVRPSALLLAGLLRLLPSFTPHAALRAQRAEADSRREQARAKKAKDVPARGASRATERRCRFRCRIRWSTSLTPRCQGRHGRGHSACRCPGRGALRRFENSRTRRPDARTDRRGSRLRRYRALAPPARQGPDPDAGRRDRRRSGRDAEGPLRRSAGHRDPGDPARRALDRFRADGKGHARRSLCLALLYRKAAGIAHAHRKRSICSGW
jgi:hypothetical protein